VGELVDVGGGACQGGPGPTNHNAAGF